MTSVPGNKPIEILLVDDDPAAVRLAQETIKSSNHQTNVSVAEDGDMAMAILRKEGMYADMPSPALILLNLRLPKMDGPEVLNKINADPNLVKIPVMILANTEADVSFLATHTFHPGRYCRKPLQLQRLNQVINQLESFSREPIVIVTLEDPDFFNENPRREFVFGLRKLGIDASLVNRDDPREAYQSLGLIEIRGEVIGYIDLIQESTSSPGGAGQIVTTEYYLPAAPIATFDLRSNRQRAKGGGLKGRPFVALDWVANKTKMAKDIAARLSADESVKSAILTIGDVSIGCNPNGYVIRRDTLDVPTQKMWKAVLAIAGHILDAHELSKEAYYHDPTRDKFALALKKLGVDVSLVDSGDPRESPLSSGLIEVHGEPIGYIDLIRWAIDSVIMRVGFFGIESRAGGTVTLYDTIYHIPAAQVESIKVKSARKKRLPLIGPVVGLRWKSNSTDLGRELARRLSADDSLESVVMATGDEVTINSDENAYVIATNAKETPSPQEWEAVRAIACHLLTAIEGSD